MATQVKPYVWVDEGIDRVLDRSSGLLLFVAVRARQPIGAIGGYGRRIDAAGDGMNAL